ncbi:MAG: hypothetical protein BYD32DRAFT_452374 [Podila humilis]|nr:MAG: hypothetical protein BYD32DRAFT_452374 [Podila humilis]
MRSIFYSPHGDSRQFLSMAYNSQYLVDFQSSLVASSFSVAFFLSRLKGFPLGDSILIRIRIFECERDILVSLGGHADKVDSPEGVDVKNFLELDQCFFKQTLGFGFFLGGQLFSAVHKDDTIARESDVSSRVDKRLEEVPRDVSVQKIRCEVENEQRNPD